MFRLPDHPSAHHARSAMTGPSCCRCRARVTAAVTSSRRSSPETETEIAALSRSEPLMHRAVAAHQSAYGSKARQRRGPTSWPHRSAQGAMGPMCSATVPPLRAPSCDADGNRGVTRARRKGSAFAVSSSTSGSHGVTLHPAAALPSTAPATRTSPCGAPAPASTAVEKFLRVALDRGGPPHGSHGEHGGGAPWVPEPAQGQCPARPSLRQGFTRGAWRCQPHCRLISVASVSPL